MNIGDSHSKLLDDLLALDPYSMDDGEKLLCLLPFFKSELARCASIIPAYRRYLESWPLDYRQASEIWQLPFLPVSLFKQEPPLSLVPSEQVVRVMQSSATTGQMPSSIPLDRITATRMTKGVVKIIQDFIGGERRPYLVIDTQQSNLSGVELGARTAAIRALSPFASTTTYALKSNSNGVLEIDEASVKEFASTYTELPVLVYGFTSILWFDFVERLEHLGARLQLKNAYVLHSGGWKKLLDRSVSKSEFSSRTAQVFGCPEVNVIDYYGMVENLGIVYPDCAAGNKHAPVTGAIVVRDPVSLQPVTEGESGILQVCSILPNSFPGHLLLTEDVATVVNYSGCHCGRPGVTFRFAGRIPKAEVRGCGNIARVSQMGRKT